MDSIRIKDKNFEVFISELQIQQAIKKLAERMNSDLKDKCPLFVGVLNGSFMFVSDLLKNIETECEVSFIKVSSYCGTSTSGSVKNLIGFNEQIKGRTVIVCEDIIDSGITMENIISELKQYEPAEVKLATLLFKPGSFKKNYHIDYIAIEIPDDFILGYGLDYDGFGRNYRDIYKIIN